MVAAILTSHWSMSVDTGLLLVERLWDTPQITLETTETTHGSTHDSEKPRFPNVLTLQVAQQHLISCSNLLISLPFLPGITWIKLSFRKTLNRVSWIPLSFLENRPCFWSEFWLFTSVRFAINACIELVKCLKYKTLVCGESRSPDKALFCWHRDRGRWSRCLVPVT